VKCGVDWSGVDFRCGALRLIPSPLSGSEDDRKPRLTEESPGQFLSLGAHMSSEVPR
jgi:hypothetical protein